MNSHHSVHAPLGEVLLGIFLTAAQRTPPHLHAMRLTQTGGPNAHGIRPRAFKVTLMPSRDLV
jgi:hypothetical protein